MGFLTLSKIRKLTERKDAIGLLKIVLKESDPQVKISAINSLGVIKATIAVENLIEMLETEKRIDIRKAVAIALGKIQSPKAVVPLIEFLKKEQDIVWKLVEEALISINDNSMVEELEKIYNEKGYEYAKECADNVIKYFKGNIKPASVSKIKVDEPINKSEVIKENLPKENNEEEQIQKNSSKVQPLKNFQVKNSQVKNSQVKDKKRELTSKKEDFASKPDAIGSKFENPSLNKNNLKSLNYYVDNIKFLKFYEIEEILSKSEQFSVDDIISNTQSEDQKEKCFAVSLLGKHNDEKSFQKLVEIAKSDDVFIRVAAIVSLYNRKSVGKNTKDFVSLLSEPVHFLRTLVIEIFKKSPESFVNDVTKFIKSVHCNYVRSKMISLLSEHGFVSSGSLLEVLDSLYKKDIVKFSKLLAKHPNYFIDLLDIKALKDSSEIILFLSKVNVPVVTGYLANKVEVYERNEEIFETLLTHFYLSGINEYISIPVSYLYNKNEKFRMSAAKILLANKWKPVNPNDYVAVLVAGNFWKDIEKKGEAVLKYMVYFAYFKGLKEKIMDFCLNTKGLLSAEFLSNYFIDKDSSIQLAALKSFDSLMIEPTGNIIEKLKLALYSDTGFVQKEALRILEKKGWRPDGEKETIICKIIKDDWDGIKIFDPKSAYSIKSALSNKSWIIRQKAVALLGDLNYSLILNDILLMLNDREKQVQVTVLKVLIYFYEKDPSLLSKYLLDDNPDIRMAAAVTINEADKKDLRDEIISKAILNETEFFIKSNKQTTDALLDLFNISSGFYKEEVVSILLKIGWKPETGEQKILVAACDKNFEYLEKAGNKGLVYLISMISDLDATVAQKAVKTIIKIGKDSLFYVMELLKSDLWSERKTATYILGKIHCDESLHALSELAFSDRNNKVRLEAIKAIASFNSSDIINILCDLYFDKDETIRDEVLKNSLKYSNNKFLQLFLSEKSNESEIVFNKVFELCNEENDIELFKMYLFSQSHDIRLQVFQRLPFLKRKGVEIKGDIKDFERIENSGITGYIPYNNII